MDKLSTETDGTHILGIAFDMDGLLLNTEDLYEHVGQELLRRRGKSYREEVRRQMIGLPAPQAFGVLIEHEGLSDSWQELQQETDAIFEVLLERELALMRGVDRLLTRLEQANLPRCVATSSTQKFARRALGLAGILDRLDFVITAQDVPRGKPHPDIYKAAAQRMGIPTTRMMVLEDSEHGAAAGLAAQAMVIAVPNQHTRHGRFHGVHLIADSLEDQRIYAHLEEMTR
jgi:HAD superfamily hydrolase (TIGR01509 family)